MSDPKKTMTEFCKDHAIRVVDTNKRAYKHARVNVEFFKYPNDYNIIDSSMIKYDTEPLLTVEIAQSELERIAEFEQQVFNNMKQTGHYNMFETLMEQKEQEKYLRQRYAAVNKAYEHYSLMLKLAMSGELKE